MAKVTLVTGGARSGKSAHALFLALARKAETRVFIATATAFDREMEERILRHKEERGPEWETVEAPLDLAGAVQSRDDAGVVVVVDCLTVWMGNLLHHNENLPEEPPAVREFLKALEESRAREIFVVTNEVGMGIVPENALARRFRDAAGRVNQRVADHANRVILMVSGQPLTVKDKG